MHEIGIANSILEAVRAETLLHPGQFPTKVAVRIGELAAVDTEALRFSFEALTKETDFESLNLEIELCNPRYLCRECNLEFTGTQFDSSCPKCRSEHTNFLSGDQLELAYLEMEEHESSTA